VQQQHEILSNAREKDPQRNNPKKFTEQTLKASDSSKLRCSNTAQRKSKVRRAEQSRAELRVEVTKLFDPKRMAPGN